MRKEIDTNVAEKKARKPKVLTLICGILTIIFAVVMIGVAFYVGYAMLGDFFNKGTSGDAGSALAFAMVGWLIIPFFMLIAGVILVVAIMNLVSGIFAVVAATKEDKKFLDHKGLVITSIVFDFLALFGLGIFGFVELFNKNNNAMVLGAVVLAAAAGALIIAVLKIVELTRVSKRYKVFVETNKTQNPQTASNNKEKSAVEKDLERYNKMLEEGTITKEEYDKLRAKALKLDE